jgi:ankyrin repeat protein
VSVRRLPSEPSLEHLRNEAKELQRRHAAGDAAAIALAAELHPRAAQLTGLRRADAQLVVARSYGFPSWPRLRSYVDTVSRYRQPKESGDGLVDRFLRLACLTYAGDGPERRQEARELLTAQPELARASIHTIAAVGDGAAAAELLARDRSQARLRGGPHGWEPLLYAAYSRLDSTEPGCSTLEVARLLLDHGADPNAGFLGSWGPPPFTALTGAFGYGEDAPNQPPHQYQIELARLLLDHGADPNDEQTLYNNLWRRTNEHLQLLFAYGLGRGDGGPWQRRLAPMLATPTQMLEDQLLFSADGGNLERVELLIEHGVDVNGLGTRHPTLRGRNALELAVAAGDERVADALRRAGAVAGPLDPVEDLLAACLRGDRGRVDALLGADPGLPAAAVGRDPERLAKAVELNRSEAVRLLVEIGFDVNGRHRTTPLHLAAYDGNRPMAELLLELGADPAVTDDEFGATPAAWARHAHHDELAEFLDTNVRS